MLRLSSYIKSIFRIITLVIFTLAFSGAQVGALSQEQKNLYKSGIYYYDIGASDFCSTVSTSSSNSSVYVIGDSYSQGIEGSLRPKLAEQGYEVSSWNGLQGRSIDGGGNDPSGVSQSGLQAIDADSDSIKKSGKMIVLLGTNGISSSDIASFMGKVATYNPNIQTYWVNVNYPKGTKDSIDQRNKSISDGASEFKYTVVDWYKASVSQESQYFGSDGIHPSSSGYKAMTDLITSALQPQANSDTQSSVDISGINNTDYAGNKILNQAQLDAIKANQPFYQSSADKYGIPWQMIAVIHLREHGLQRDGPSNGQGPYQFESGGYKVGEYTDAEFQKATDDAAEFIKNKAGDRKLNTIENIKYTLFAYNGRSPVYIKQALDLGFTEEQASIGEGSPYVMNRADLKRDPTVEPTKSNNTWGQFKPDFQYPANTDYGAFVQYSALANVSASGGCGKSGLSAGGMTMEQAKEFMETYVKSPDSEKYVFRGAGGNPRAGGSILANCTAFSSYFINKYTTLKGLEASPVGHGFQTVTTITTNNPGLEPGTEPKVYAVFSYPTGEYGHTGVVLGIDLEKGIVITGEASWNGDLTTIGAYTHTLQEIKDEGWTFAYTDGYQKGL
jgi:lysophospholipase L1-like esterase